MFETINEDLYLKSITNNADISAEMTLLERWAEDNNYIFRNTHFSLIPRVLFINAELRKNIITNTENMMEILEKVLDVYYKDQATRNYFMLSPIQSELVNINCGYYPRIRISRFDTLLDQDKSSIKILENNTDCPAGTLFTGRVMKLFQRLKFFDNRDNLALDPISSELSFVSELLQAYGDTKPNIAILQIKDRSNAESEEIAKILNGLGYTTIIADPRELSYQSKTLYCKELPVHLIWNKINTVYFNELLDEYASLQPFFSACQEQSVCHINPFSARYITESKLCLAYLRDKRFQHHFEEQEIKLINHLLPWACKLIDEPTEFKGEVLPISQLAIKYQQSLVLKAAYDIRGDGVILGKTATPMTWRDLIADKLGKAFILQEYIQPPRLSVFNEKIKEITKMNFSLDCFMFGGRFAGFGSKISHNEKLNIFQGGSKLPVYSLR